MKRITTYILSFLFGIESFAQQAFTNNGNLQVHPGTALTGFGNFSNVSSGTLVNNGSIYIKGNTTNDQSSMAAGTGTLYLNGSNAQAVNGSQTFKTYNLVTNNNAGITLNNNLSVSGAHTFSSGMITTSATPNYLVYESGASYSGDGDTRHVNGWVKKFGSANFEFPVGDATFERTAGIRNLSATSEINCHYFTNTQNVFNLSSPLVMVNGNEYWVIDKISGGTAQIALNWDNAKVPFINALLSDLRAAHYTGGNWTSVGGSASGNVSSTGNITSNAVSSFSPFTIGATSYPLSLDITSLTAERRSGANFLHWITENEQFVDYFEIELSYDAVHFTTIGNVTSRNFTIQHHYDFEDRLPLSAIAYYRIKAVEFDGKFIYSRIVAVTEKALAPPSFVVLNPAIHGITIFNKTGKDGLFDYRLFNAGGQLVQNGNVYIANNAGVVLPVSPITTAGVYMLELSNENVRFRQRILIRE